MNMNNENNSADWYERAIGVIDNLNELSDDYDNRIDFYFSALGCGGIILISALLTLRPDWPAESTELLCLALVLFAILLAGHLAGLLYFKSAVHSWQGHLYCRILAANPVEDRELDSWDDQFCLRVRVANIVLALLAILGLIGLVWGVSAAV